MSAQLIQYPGPGCVVEFMQGNTPQLAYILEDQGGKLRLLLPNRREMSMQPNRLLPWSGPQLGTGKSRDEITGSLANIKEKRDTLAAGMQALDLWELVAGEVDKASVTWLAELVSSNPSVDEIAGWGHTLLDCKSHFRFNPPEFEILAPTMVEQRKQAEDVAKEREAMIGGGVEWFKHLLAARQDNKDPELAKCPPKPVCDRLSKLLRDRITDPANNEDIALWRQLTKSLPDDPHLPLLLAMTWGIVPEHYNYWLDRANYNPNPDWATPYADEIETIIRSTTRQTEATPSTYPDEIFFSIDSATTKDIDDALHIFAKPDGGWEIDVALACPALNWQFAGELDKAVASRATSIYLPEADYHMLPEKLGTDAFSLHAGQKRPVLILRICVAANGQILESRPEQAFLSLSANLTYEQCEKILTTEDTPQNPATPYANELKLALQLAQTRLNYRVTQGAVIIERPELEFYLIGAGAETQVFIRDLPEHPLAQLLVSEIMILANAALADWASKNDLPLLYRTQDVAVPPGFAGIWKFAPDVARVAKIMSPAKLEEIPRPHAGIGLTAYSPVTSPLRRYSDFINEAQVLYFLSCKSQRWSQDDLKKLLIELNASLDAAGQVQRQRPRYWKFLYLQQQARKHGNECYWEAVVSEENDAFVTINLEREQLIVRGKRAMFGDKAIPGQKLMVRLGKINPLRGEVSILEVRETAEI